MFLGAPQTDAFAAVHGEHVDPGLPAIMTSPMLAAQRPLAESLGTAQVPTSLISLGLFTWGGSKGAWLHAAAYPQYPPGLAWENGLVSITTAGSIKGLWGVAEFTSPFL